MKEDCISKLPDAILARIMSILSLKQAIRVSVLSKGYIKLWTELPRLEHCRAKEFNSLLTMYTGKTSGRTSLMTNKEFVNWVNKVMRALHEQAAPTRYLEELIIDFLWIVHHIRRMLMNGLGLLPKNVSKSSNWI